MYLFGNYFSCYDSRNFDEMNTYYFDYASTTPVDSEVVDKMKDCMSLMGLLEIRVLDLMSMVGKLKN